MSLNVPTRICRTVSLCSRQNQQQHQMKKMMMLPVLISFLYLLLITITIMTLFSSCQYHGNNNQYKTNYNNLSSSISSSSSSWTTTTTTTTKIGVVTAFHIIPIQSSSNLQRSYSENKNNQQEQPLQRIETTKQKSTSHGNHPFSTTILFANKKSKGSQSSSTTTKEEEEEIILPLMEALTIEKDSTATSITAFTDKNIKEDTIPSVKDDSNNSSNDNNDMDIDIDIEYMRMAIELAQSDGGERGEESAYPNPTVGAVLISYDEKNNEPYVLGRGRSNYKNDAVRSCIESIPGVHVTPLQEWAVSWPANPTLRRALQKSILYVTLEPSAVRKGSALPPITSLIRQVGIQKVVIGCVSPIKEYEYQGATALHNAGIQVVTNVLEEYTSRTNDTTLQDACYDCIAEYTHRAQSKLQVMARKHFERFQRPLGFLHCSVVASADVEAFARHGNAFGTNFGDTVLNFRNRGAYELAPPPDVIWADDDDDDNYEQQQFSQLDTAGKDNDENDWNVEIDFEDENYQGDMPAGTPMMPWYEQVDAVVATFPRSGNGPPDDNTVMARLNGLKWLATHGNALPAGVERILVMDATDLIDLPLYNTDPNLPKMVDVEAFWRSIGRKPTRVLLRRGLNESARAAAAAAAAATQAAAKAAQEAAAAIESGDAERAAQAALECQKIAETSATFIQQELIRTQELRRILEVEYGVIVETIEGGEPIDVMKHLGERNGMYSVVWRAGCWGERGVNAILAGAFQWVSAHLAVDAVGGRFWQLMIAENAVQAACGPESKIKVFADQDDISMEYCDEPEVDKDCVLTFEGRPVRHVRVDCRVALIDEKRKREFSIAKTQRMNYKVLTEEAPWFL